jgi:hypothetical protein
MTNEYTFRIADSYTPDTLPMKRLSEYVAAMAKLFGEEAYVHFSGVVEGSAVLKAIVDEPARPKVSSRLYSLKTGNPAKDVLKAADELDRLLKEDNATGTLQGTDDGVVIPFLGRNKPAPLVYGPFRQSGTLEGQLIRVGGKDETVPVNLKDGDVVHTGLYCSMELAKRIAAHFLGPVLRVHGVGGWLRLEDGTWALQNFRINEFEVLDDAPLLDVVEEIRDNQSGNWHFGEAPIKDLLDERNGEGGVN